MHTWAGADVETDEPRRRLLDAGSRWGVARDLPETTPRDTGCSPTWPCVAVAVEVVAEPIQQGRTQQLWQVVITRAQDGKAVARGQVRLQNIDASTQP
jgi:hypothetical protein